MKLLIIIGILAISLTGCGADKDKLEPAPVEDAIDTEDEDGTPDVTNETETDETETDGPDEEGGANAPTNSLGDKDTSAFTEEDIPQTNLEDIGGEGMVDDTVPDLTGMEESPVGEPVKFTDATGKEICLFAIESVESSDMEIENMGDVADKKVVIVSYSYTNMAVEDNNILFDDMSFKLLVDDTTCMPYFSPKLTPAASSGVGETAFGQVAFLAPKSCTDVIVVFDNRIVNAKMIFKTTVE